MSAGMDRYMQYRLAEQDEDCVDSFTELLTNNNGKKNGRGPTQMRDIWSNHDGTKMQITCNEFGQPHDKNASKLTNFIGTLVRDGKNAPINYKSWHKEKFDIPPLAENWTMRSCGKELKNWKAYLKRTYYSETLSFEEQKKYKDKRVYAGQWEELIKYWASEDAKKISATNKASRGQKKYNHITGTKSFTQIRAAQKENGGSTPTRDAMFNVCYTKKDKSVTDTTKEVMVQLQEKQELNEDVSKEKGMNDTFSKVMGKEKYGSVRMYGFGVCSSDVWENKSTKKGNQKKYIQTLEAELKELRSQVQANKQNYNANDTSIIPDMAKKPCMSHNKESRRQLWFSSSAYDIPIVEVGEMVNLKSVTADPETIVIGLVVSKDSSKEVGGKELGDHYSEVVVQVCINPDEELIRPYGQCKTIGEVVGASIAWPTTFLKAAKLGIVISEEQRVHSSENPTTSSSVEKNRENHHAYLLPCPISRSSDLWRPPQDWLKLNCDVRVGLDSMCVVVVARNHVGKVIWVATSKLEFVDALCGEAMA
ncbi:uncharacterized protein LOC133031404 [Cannabis sativa]|uniref:uncharacterized protein LOC133031404 n=1 Tax=Cannabis sativa TaxID=3483 RepID=UPI0029C9CA7C|nr:uncharacterized protein LOC133031404 [Cannabis sativa]